MKFLGVTFYKILFIDRNKITKDMTNEDREEGLGSYFFCDIIFIKFQYQSCPRKYITLDNGKCSTQMS